VISRLAAARPCAPPESVLAVCFELAEDMLGEAVSSSPDSMVFEPANIETISQTLWMRVLRANGEKFGVTNKRHQGRLSV
jgi:hypothetical protein